MSRFAKLVASVAAVGVLVVLITPVADELPCTARHRVPFMPYVSLIVTSVLARPILSYAQSPAGVVKVFSGTTLLSLTCTLLC
jgi:hypothetical protein